MQEHAAEDGSKGGVGGKGQAFERRTMHRIGG